MDKVITTWKVYDNHLTVLMLFLFGSKYILAPEILVIIVTVLMTTQAFWDAISRRLLNNYWRLGAAQCLHLYSETIKEE